MLFRVKHAKGSDLSALKGAALASRVKASLRQASRLNKASGPAA